MKNYFISLISLFFCSLIIPCIGNESRIINEELSQILKKEASQENFSGAILIAKNKEVLFKQAYGLACRRYQVQNNIDTKFNLASIGKIFTSVAIAQLAQAGKLSLEDPISKYLIDWIPKTAADSISIGDLLIHSSGLGSFFDNEKFIIGGSSGLYLNIKDYKPLVAEEKMAFKPGTSQSYSNTGYLLLGAIIEAVSGQSYFDYVEQNIFKPAKMLNSGFFEMDDPIPNLAIGFGRYKNGNDIYWKNNLFSNVLKGSPAGGGFSTAQDMCNFANALMDGTLLNSEYSQRVLSGKIKQPEDISKYYRKTIISQGQTYEGLFSPHGFAGEWNEFGFAIFSTEPLIVGHNGGGMRGINNNFVIYPVSGYNFILFANYTGEGILDPNDLILKIVTRAAIESGKTIAKPFK